MRTPVRSEPAGAGLFRPKGHLPATGLRVLLVLAALPLVSMALRSLALPGLLGVAPGPLGELGAALSQLFSLRDVPPDQRDHVLYLLFLPTSALLVALARLTFGIRVMGFRSILISVGFHQSGFLPSLLLITVAIAAIVVLRPWLRRIRLPYYARVSVILCVVAITMVGGLVAGPWLQSDILWGAAYFPVIVLGMLAEGIAHTLERDNPVTASWRAITTILLAFLIALIGWMPPLRALLLEFPELVLAQVVAIVMVSEYLDLRLFQGWDLKAAAILLPRLLNRTDTFRVAVVCERPVPHPGGPAAGAEPRRRMPGPARRVARALRRRGFGVAVMDAGPSLPGALRRFLGPVAEHAPGRGLVLPLALADRAAAPRTNLPAMLEPSGIPCAGPGAIGHAIGLDPAATRALLVAAGIPTPACVEERLGGRQIRVALIGNAPPRCLPLVELHPVTGRKLCPAPLDEDLARRVRACARAAFRTCGCRDVARVDLGVGAAGDIRVIAVRSHGILARGGSFLRAALEAGLTFDRLIGRIVGVARARAGGPPTRLRLGARPGVRPRHRTGAMPPTGARGCSRAAAGA